MTRIQMLDLKRLHAPLRAELVRAFEEILDSSAFINGPPVERFEAELAAHVGADRAVGVSSGTDALLVALMALGVGPGDEVITTPYTFFATAGCASRLGAKPVFVDIEPDGYNMDASLIEAAITDRTVGIIPVHLFGRCADMDAVSRIAAERGLWVLEDAAQSIGATHSGRQAGTMGTVGTYSFFPAKNLGALGDGGAVVTSDAALADRMVSLRNHGSKRKYHHEEVGGNFRLDALQAAFLSVKLPALRGWEEGRRRVAARYAEAFAGVAEVIAPREDPAGRHVFNQYVVRIAGGRRDRVKAALEAAGIGCAVYYPAPLSVQPCFAYLGRKEGDFPEAERASRETLAIPVDPLLTAEQQALVVGTIEEAAR
jgi:dTDP-4-amino-4,6-dideoxygalactose transaminase